MTPAETWSAAQISRMTRGLMEAAAATTTIPAVTACGTAATSGAARMTRRTISTAANTAAQRVRAPAATLTDVAATEPPTVAPPKNPEAMLASPWAEKSRETSPWCPSALRTERLMPAPCTRPMMVSESAGSRSRGTREMSGSWGAGKPPETGAMSPMVATDEKKGSAASAVPATSATPMAKSFAGVSPMRSTTATVAAPRTRVAGSMWPACRRRSPAFRTLFSKPLEKPVRAPSCPRMMWAATPVMKPTITAWEMKRVRPPPRSSPAASIMSPVSSVSTTRPGTFCSCGRWAREAPTVRLSAAVVTIAMRCVPAVSAPTGVPVIVAYSPCTGGTPATIVYASVRPICVTPRVNPASRSWGRSARDGRRGDDRRAVGSLFRASSSATTAWLGLRRNGRAERNRADRGYQHTESEGKTPIEVRI